MDTFYTNRKAFIFSKNINGVKVIHSLTMTERTMQALKWIVEAYSHVLENGEHTPKQFADSIKQTYDQSEPHNAKAVYILNQLHDLEMTPI